MYGRTFPVRKDEERAAWWEYTRSITAAEGIWASTVVARIGARAPKYTPRKEQVWTYREARCT